MSHKYPSKAHAPFDLDGFLTSEEHAEQYLEAVAEENDPVKLQAAIDAVERARRKGLVR